MHRVSLDLQERAEANLQIISKIGFVLMMGFVGIVLGVTIILLYKRLVIDQYSKVLDDLATLVSTILELV